MLTRVVLPVVISLMKMSSRSFESPATKLLEELRNATSLPLALILGSKDKLLPGMNDESELTCSVVPVILSLIKTSKVTLASPPAKLFARLEKATYRPSSLILGCCDSKLPIWPPEPVLTIAIAPVVRSLTKMSSTPLSSPATKLLAELRNATNFPFALILG